MRCDANENGLLGAQKWFSKEKKNISNIIQFSI